MSAAMVDQNGYGGQEMYSDRHHPGGYTVHDEDHYSPEQHQQMYNLMRQKAENTPSTRNGHYKGSYSQATPSISSHSQSSPRRPVYYRIASPEQGLPLGRYEQQRKVFDDIRHWEYNKLLKEINEKEQQDIDNRQKQSQMQSMMAATQRSNCQNNMYDYDEMKEKFSKERKQAYQEFLKEKEAKSRYRSQPTPPGGGLPVGLYEQKKKRLKDDLVAEYKASLDMQKQEKLDIQLKNISENTAPAQTAPYPDIYFHDPEEVKKNLAVERHRDYNKLIAEQEKHPRRRPVTPPVGLNIPTQMEREKDSHEKKKQYAQELIKQSTEQKRNRAQHYLGIPVLDRSHQHNGYHSRHQPPQEQDTGVYRDQQILRPRDHDYQGPHLPKEPIEPRSPSQRYPSPQRSPQLYSPSKSNREPPQTGSWSNNPHANYESNQTPDYRQRYKPGRSSHQTPSYWDNGMPVQSPPMSVSSRGSRASTQRSGRSNLTPLYNENPPPHLNLQAYREDPMKEYIKQERRRGYEELKAKQAQAEEKKANDIERRRRMPATQPRYGNFDNAEQHDIHKKRLEEEKRTEYQSYVAQSNRNFKRKRKSRSDSRRPRSHEELRIPDTSSTNTQRFEERPRSANSATRRRGSTGHLDAHHDKKNQNGRRHSGDFTTSQSYGNFGNASSRSDDVNDYSQKSPARRRTPDKFGLPLNQRFYDEQRARQEKQRNKEYNDFLDKRGVPFDKDVIKHVNQYHSGRAQKTLKRYLLKKVEGEHPVIQLYKGKKSLLEEYVDPATHTLIPWRNGLPIGQHRYKDWHHMLEHQRNTEYNHVKQETPGTPDDFRPRGKKEGINVDSQGAFPTGEYDKKRSQLQQDWKKSYHEYADKQRQQATKNHQSRVRSEMSFRERENMDTPPILPHGEYREKRKKYKETMKEDYQSYVKTLPSVDRNKSFWEAEDKPRIIPSSGEHRQRKERYINERIKEFRQHMEQVEPPKERKKVFGEQGAVLFEGKYGKVKEKMNAQRKQEMLDFYQKKQSEVPRRHADPSNDKRSMFTDMGAHDQERNRNNESKTQDHKNYPNEAPYQTGPSPGRLNFADGRSNQNNWYAAEPGPIMKPSHSREPIGQTSNQPSYDVMLENKRQEEASYRRYDPEFTHPDDYGGISQQRY